MGTAKKPAPTKQAQSSKNRSKYEAQFLRTSANKARRLKQRAAWLAKRQSPDVTARMADAWILRHPSDGTNEISVIRYHQRVLVAVKHRKPNPDARAPHVPEGFIL